ncbi:hypothetical protein ACWGKW_24185 [Streptomyces sp. NPDC054766]
MFEIRVICDWADSDRVSGALSAAFTTGSVRQHPTRDGQRTRLYITADHRAEREQPPAQEEAYALAPSITREIGWTARTAANKPFGIRLPRDFWLRKAALLDRIALQGEADNFHGVACEAATEAAEHLMRLDGTDVICAPRGYVRQEYARWAKNQ